jgi:hypothetical protein
MVTHERARTVLALLGCNWVVLDAVFVHWPLRMVRGYSIFFDGDIIEYFLDNKMHCIWGPAHESPTMVCWQQQGVGHRTGGPSWGEFDRCTGHMKQMTWHNQGTRIEWIVFPTLQ